MTDQVCPRCKGDGEVPLSASFAGGKSKMCGKCQGTGKDLSKPTAPPTPATDRLSQDLGPEYGLPEDNPLVGSVP